MKTRIKNLLLLLLLLGLPGVVQAQVNYAVSGNTAYVTYSASAIDNVVITNNYDGYPVTSIGAYAGRSWKVVTIPTNINGLTVTSIGIGAFFSSGLTNVTVPDSVTSIGGEVAFDLCGSLTNIAVNAANPNYSSTNGVLFDKDQATLIQYPNGLTNSSYTIPNSVTYIGAYAFDGTSLTSVTIGNSVTSIGDYAFVGCPS